MIEQTAGAPLVYSGLVIRDRGEMLCLTDMWRAAGSDPNKRPIDWSRREGAQFIEFMSETLNVAHSHDELFQVVRGGRSPSTWAHWQIGFAYAKYLSPEFHAWCNSVVRAHMEGRGVSVTQAPVIALSRADLKEFADSVGEAAGRAAGRAAAERCVELMDTRMQAALKPVEDRLAAVESIVSARRRIISKSTKDQHIHDIYELGARCPCCGIADVIDKEGNRSPFTDFDHFYQNSYPDPDATWLVCKPCHRKLTTGGAKARTEHRPAFEAYQTKRRVLPGRQGQLF